MRIELHKLLEALPILELLFGLRIAQAVEMLQDHDAQQHTHAAGGPFALAVSRGHTRLHFARNGLKHAVGRTALLHGQIEEGGLVVSRSLHELQITPSSSQFKILLQRFPLVLVGQVSARAVGVKPECVCYQKRRAADGLPHLERHWHGIFVEHSRHKSQAPSGGAYSAPTGLRNSLGLVLQVCRPAGGTSPLPIIAWVAVVALRPANSCSARIATDCSVPAGRYLNGRG